MFTVYIPKQTRGEIFPDLDLQTLLLTRRQAKAAEQAAVNNPRRLSVPASPLIEVLDSAPASGADGGGEGGNPPCGDSSDAAPKQAVAEDEAKATAVMDEELPPLLLTPSRGVCYGFDGKYSGVLGPLATEIPEVVDLPSPDSCAASERSILRHDDEERSFDEDYYV